tara:strand:- start:497 stop:811 length:315 start_codon:yes stop_codon:yes gene_type:complete
MGLRDMLKTQGSTLSNANGGSIPTPTGATKQSKLQDEYSINGTPDVPFKGYFTNYKVKPKPSQIDLNGVNPLAPLESSTKPQFGDGFKNGTYKKSAPAEGIGRI